MLLLYAILLTLAGLSFLLEAFGIVVNKVNLIALGLFFWVLVPLIQVLQAA